MSDITFLGDIEKLPFIIANDNVIIEVSQSFVDMTEFKSEDFKNKNIIDLFRVLRVGPGVSYENVDDTTDYFLFTKSFEVKFVNIKVIVDIQEKVYVFLEKNDSNLDIKLPVASTLCSDNYYGIGIYSMPDMTLLKANDKYMNFSDEPFNKKENCIGKHISEFTIGFKGSTFEDIWSTVLKTGKSYNVEEYKYEGVSRGITYWKIFLIPICEDGRIKYCVVMNTEITEQVLHRRKIEEQEKIIKEQNKCLRWQAGLLNHSREAIFAWDLDGGIVYWNKGAERMYGYSREKAFSYISHELLKTVYPEPFENIKLTMLNKGLWNGEVEHTRIDGTKLIVETYHQIMIDENGHKVVLETNRDITKRKRMEIELRNQKNQLEEIIHSIDDIIFIYDTNKNYYMLNNSAKQYFLKEELNKFGDVYDKYKYYDSDDNEISLEKIITSRVFNGEMVVNDRVTVRSNKMTKYFSVNGRPIYDSEGNIKFAVICSHDITQEIEANKMIEQQKERLNAIINSMADGLELVDNKTKITFLNQSAKDFFYNPDVNVNAGDSLKYNKYYYGINGDEIPREDLPTFRVFNEGSFQNYILTIERPDKKIYTSINGSSINTHKDTEKEAILSIRDITEQIKKDKIVEFHQKAALQAEKEKNEALEKAMDMKDEFLSLISHEFRTPLNVINTAIQALNYLCGSELSDRSKRYINTIRQNTFRQLRLVNNLLDITRADAGRIKIHKKNIDIVFLTNSIVESVHTYSSQKRIRIIFNSSVEKKVIAIDDEKYERILLNLLSNAIKFTPEGKSITVKLRALKNNIRIEVKDNGIGIPKDKVDVIFERFGQVDSSLSRQAEGSGIGLSLVKRFVDALGGTISVKSKVGKGSKFIIILPNEKVLEKESLSSEVDLLDNRLVQVTTVEFSDIYL